MHILPEYNHPYSIDNVSESIIPKHCWFYDADLNDFLLRPIRLLEETTGPTVQVKILDVIFSVPASWNMMVMDDETKMVDTVQITQCSSSNYQAFLMHPEVSSYIQAPIVLLDLNMKESCSHVTIPRMHMMLHPIAKVRDDRRKTEYFYSCLLSPQDLGKHMGNMTAMELLI